MLKGYDPENLVTVVDSDHERPVHSVVKIDPKVCGIDDHGTTATCENFRTAVTGCLQCNLQTLVYGGKPGSPGYQEAWDERTAKSNIGCPLANPKEMERLKETRPNG